MSGFQYFLIFGFLAIASSPALAVKVNRIQQLDDDYQVSWTADLKAESIIFLVTARTTGFVGFGLSPSGGMNNADVVIGGVKDGVPYFSDRYSTGKSEPTVDDSQDWLLVSGYENTTHTTLSFSRKLNTCDEQDLPINNDTTKFIWSIGATDDIRYHAKRGAASVNILDPAAPVQDTSEFDIWHVNVNTTMPKADTTYWCTAHKSPAYDSMRHIVGFRVKLDNEESLTHNHHMILHHCVGSTPELIEYYESFVGKPGGLCYNGNGVGQMMQTCKQYMYVWAKGGDPLFLPENVGIPLSEFGQPEYFLLEIHYDNPQMLEGVRYETGLEVYTSTKIREQDAGILTIGHAIRFTLMIPPDTTNYTIAGHCSSACTQKQIPVGGINVFNILLHSHLAGRALKLRQFRNGVELPWVGVDNHYDFNYQQNRALPEYRKILRGDHLTFECTDETSDRSPPEAVLGGQTTRDEMCETFLMYYPRMTNLDVCASAFAEYQVLARALGIQGADLSNLKNPLITAPAKYANKRYSEVVSNLIPWDDTLRNTVENLSRFGDHDELCGSYSQANGANQIQASKVSYPEFKPYEPIDVCKAT